MKGVEVIRDPKKAKVFVDPMRREILRLLSHHEMTENQLAGTLGLTDSAVGHHLKILRSSRLIGIARRVIEKHGITQKFYEANALLYLVDSREMSLEIDRYLMPISMERIRGIVAAINALSSEPKMISTIEAEKFSKLMTSAILHIASGYSDRSNLDREELIGLMYRDALLFLVKKKSLLPEKVQMFFSNCERKRAKSRIDGRLPG